MLVAQSVCVCVFCVVVTKYGHTDAAAAVSQFVS